MEYKLDQDQRESLKSMGVNAMVLPHTEEYATLKNVQVGGHSKIM